MTKVSLSDIKKFQVLDEESGQLHLGSDQEWYSGEFQRHAGCGPSVASNLIHYQGYDGSNGQTSTKKDFVALMEEVWHYVTPLEGRGLPSTDLFYRSLLDYTRDKALHVCRFAILDMHTPGTSCPSFSEMVRLLAAGLSCDLPVAFLCLDSGEEEALDDWHWVTVTALEYEGESAYIEILDNGELKRADAALWYNTTRLGGGFVYFGVE